MFRHFRSIVQTTSFPSCTFSRFSPIRRATSAVASNLSPPSSNAHEPTSNLNSQVALSDVPKVWTTLSQEARSSITNSLLKAQQGDWKALNMDQKRALFYIAYGEYGPRQTLPKGFQLKVFLYTMATIGVSVIIFYFVSVRNAKHPRTMTREWQEATNEYMKEQKSNPLTGIASKDYKGRGYVTSFPTNPKET